MSSGNPKLTDRRTTVTDTLPEQKLTTDYSCLEKREKEFIEKLAKTLASSDDFNSYRFMDFCSDFFRNEGFIDLELMIKSVFTSDLRNDVENTIVLLRNVKKGMNPQQFEQFAIERATYLAHSFLGGLKLITLYASDAGYQIDRARADVDDACKKMIADITATFSNKKSE